MESWYVLYTKPHKERQVSSLLQSKSYDTYLPTMPVRKNGKEKSEPLFSCYLFVRMDASLDLLQVRWTPGLRTVVMFGGQPAAVPDGVVSFIKHRLAQMRESGYGARPFKPGERVIVRSGPLKDLEGIFDRGLSSRDRARILIDFLGRWTPCEIEIDHLGKAR